MFLKIARTGQTTQTISDKIGQAMSEAVTPCETSVFYDQAGGAKNSFYVIASDESQRVGLLIEEGFSGIGEGLESVTFYGGQFDATGNYHLRHRRNDNTIVNSYTGAVSEIPADSYGLVTNKTMTSGCQVIQEGDRITIEYNNTILI